MKLVLAEKPSVAQSIAKVVNFWLYPYQEYKSREMQIISKTR